MQPFLLVKLVFDIPIDANSRRPPIYWQTRQKDEPVFAKTEVAFGCERRLDVTLTAHAQTVRCSLHAV